MPLSTALADWVGLSRDNRRIALSLFVWAIGEGLFIYLIPLYLRELGADPVMIGAILGGEAIIAGLTHVPAGYLADRFGRKPVFVFAFGLGAAAALGMFLARDLAQFVAALVAYQLTAFLMAPLTAYITEARGTHSIQRAISLVFTGYWAGLIFSPALGGLLARSLGMRALFGLGCGFLALTILIQLWLTPQPAAPHPPGQARYTALFRNWRFLGFLGLMLAALSAIQIGFPLMPNFIVEVRGFDVGVVGLLGSVNSLGATVLHLVLGDRLPRRAFMLAQLSQALALALLLATASLPWLLVAYFLRAGWFLARSMATAQVGRVVASSELGLALGLTETVITLALVGGPLIAGLLYHQAPALPFQVSLALIAVTLPLMWRYAPRRDSPTPDHAAGRPPALPET